MSVLVNFYFSHHFEMVFHINIYKSKLFLINVFAASLCSSHAPLFIYNGSCLMWSLIMLSFHWCDQIYPDWPRPKNPSISYFLSVGSCVIFQLMFSLYLGPKVIKLSSFHCNMHKQKISCNIESTWIRLDQSKLPGWLNFEYFGHTKYHKMLSNHIRW